MDLFLPGLLEVFYNEHLRILDLGKKSQPDKVRISQVLSSWVQPHITGWSHFPAVPREESEKLNGENGECLVPLTPLLEHFFFLKYIVAIFETNTV